MGARCAPVAQGVPARPGALRHGRRPRWTAVAASSSLDSGASGDRIREPREPRLETEILSNAATIHDRVEGARTLGVRTIRRRLTDGCEERGERRRFVIDHVVDAMRGRRSIEQARDRLRDIGVMAHRHALSRWEPPHERNHFSDVRIAIAVYERQPEHAHVQTFDSQQEPLGGELARRIGVDGCTSVILARQAATGRAVDQAGAREDKTLHGGGAGRVREIPRARIIDGVRLLGCRATEERGAVDDCIHAAHRRLERRRTDEIALRELDAMLTQRGGTCCIAHQGAHLVAAFGEVLAESTSDLSGGSGHEDLHAKNLATVARGGLEKPDRLGNRRARIQNDAMPSTVAHREPAPLSGPTAFRAAARLRSDGAAPSAVAQLSVDEWDRDMSGIALPRPEIHLVARFGPSAPRGLDVHAFGARQVVRRKLLHGGQRTVSARLHLGTPEAVLGIPASAIAGRVIDLEDLWEPAAIRRLYDQLAGARDTVAAAAVLERALTERFPREARQSVRVQLALDAARRLTSAKVNDVATELGVSERHLRRVFHETLGVSPKEFAKLERFHFALREARQLALREARQLALREARQLTRRQAPRASWASIAAAAGYYDQAHLIAEFRAISGVTPRALLGELRGAASVG